ncbi:hypothetical protein AB0H87_41925, partial [Asanoa sp. NPDC050611]
MRLPAHDANLLAEAVRSRVRAGLLVIDDLQWADPATVAAVGALAAHTRVAVALRTPHRLPAEAVTALRSAAVGWLTLPPLDASAATGLARRVAPGLGDAGVAEVIRRAGGVPLAVIALARHAAAGRPAPADRGPDTTGALPVAGPSAEVDQVAYAVAEALADLTRPARTAMAALGLLGRPADPALLGPGVAELRDAGLVVTLAPAADQRTSVNAAGPADPVEADGDTPSAIEAGDGLNGGTAAERPGGATAAVNGHDAGRGASALVAPASPYVAEVAAGMLDPASRAALHRRLADLTPDREAARHLAAAGDDAAASARALAAADAASTAGERAELLLLACDLPGAFRFMRPDDFAWAPIDFPGIAYEDGRLADGMQ